MQKDTSLLKYAQPDDTKWKFISYTNEDIKKVFDFLEKPPSSFKLNDTYENNLQTIIKTFGICIHPVVFRQNKITKPFFEEIVRQKKQLLIEAQEREEKQQLENSKGKGVVKKKPVTTAVASKKGKERKEENRIQDFEFKFILLDVMTLMSIFIASNDKTCPDMLKMWDCRLDDRAVDVIGRLCLRESNTINKIFFYYNPIVSSPTFACLTLPAARLQMLCLSECGLSMEGAKAVLDNVTPAHHDLVYIDLYGNDLGDELVDVMKGVLQRYEMLEYIGMGKNRLKDLKKLKELLKEIGKRGVDETFVKEWQEKAKERNIIVEKNKKLRTLKKPEEHVPFLHELEKMDGSNTHVVYFKQQLKMLNLMQNHYHSSVFELLKDTYMISSNLSFSMEANLPVFDNLASLRNLYGHRVLL